MAFFFFIALCFLAVAAFTVACLIFAAPAVLIGRAVEWFFSRRGR